MGGGVDAALNGDGTVDAVRASHTLEQVPREFVQLVDGVAAAEPEGAAADTIDSFEMFVSALTSGAPSRR